MMKGEFKMAEEKLENQQADEQSSEMISFGIIANAGDARSFAFQALDAAKHGDFAQADELMKKSEESSTLAHKAQTDLLFKEMNGGHTEVNGGFENYSKLLKKLIKELIELYKNK